MTNETVQVAIIMGSDSDLPVVEASFSILDDLVSNTLRTSCQRTERLMM